MSAVFEGTQRHIFMNRSGYFRIYMKVSCMKIMEYPIIKMSWWKKIQAC